LAHRAHERADGIAVARSAVRRRRGHLRAGGAAANYVSNLDPDGRGVPGPHCAVVRRCLPYDRAAIHLHPGTTRSRLPQRHSLRGDRAPRDPRVGHVVCIRQRALASGWRAAVAAPASRIARELRRARGRSDRGGVDTVASRRVERRTKVNIMQSDLLKPHSFWSASAALPAYPPLSANLTVDVCVIGAGIAGLTTAYLLAKNGISVAL